MTSYVEMVRRRLKDRNDNIVGNLDQLTDWHLRFTMRIFGDCLDEEARRKLLGSYSEYRTETELRDFARDFIPAYTAYALAELEEKKKEDESFDPPNLTQEEYQEMSPREKWPRIAARPDDVPPLQLRREIARMAMCFRPYMLSDPGFSEGVLEFALYFDLLDRLADKEAGELKAAAREIAALVEEAVAAGATKRGEELLLAIRTRAARAAGIEADPETLLGPEMERYPREAPPEWTLRELRKTLDTLSLKDLRLSALVHLDLLTAGETRELVSPFFSRFPSFYGMPSSGLKELILAVAGSAPARVITDSFDRYSTGKMALLPPVAFPVWRLMPEEERIRLLREDNAKMDQAMISRHLARYLHASSPADLADAGRQIALLTNDNFVSNHGSILKTLGGDGGGGDLRSLHDEVTVLSLRMMGCRGEERQTRFDGIRERIARAAGIKSN